MKHVMLKGPIAVVSDPSSITHFIREGEGLENIISLARKGGASRIGPVEEE